MRAKYLFRLDDASPFADSKKWKAIEDIFQRYEILPIVAVIPDNKDPGLMYQQSDSNFWKRVRGWDNRGWEIAMHGLTHVYDKDTQKKDYFRYGGRSEFCGHSLEVQTDRIKKGLKKFSEEKIEIKSFFAPNHTYDKNTFNALKNSGINEVIDGYGLMPYKEKEIKFIPQLFYKIYALPFGIQSTQIHLNYWNQKDLDNFEIFVKKNQNNLITYEGAIKKINNNIQYKLINEFTKILLRTRRALNPKS